jgi:hypothetical protein
MDSNFVVTFGVSLCTRGLRATRPCLSVLFCGMEMWGGIPTINVRMQMVCTFICTLCKYTTCIMRSLKRCSHCYWSAVDCDDRATVVQFG